MTELQNSKLRPFNESADQSMGHKLEKSIHLGMIEEASEYMRNSRASSFNVIDQRLHLRSIIMKDIYVMRCILTVIFRPVQSYGRTSTNIYYPQFLITMAWTASGIALRNWR